MKNDRCSKTFLDVESLDVSASFNIDWETGQFIFYTYKSEDENRAFMELPKEIDRTS
mgnify:CR=1 FL=1